MAKTAIITGASSGIGRELALQLARKGWQVGLLARRTEPIRALAQEINEAGGKARYHVCDVRRLEQVKEAVAYVEAELGFIELAIANAGVSYPIPVLRFDAARTKEIYDVNVIGAINLFSAVMPAMIENKRGHLVGVASLAAYAVVPVNTAYCASKAALNAQLKGLRIELRDHGVAVTTICPGFIKTAMVEKNRFPMPFLMEAPHAVGLMVRAIEGKKAYLRFPRLLFLMSLLSQILPDRVLALLKKY